MTKTALLDGDIIVYRCGFASDAGAKRQGIEHEPIEHCLHSVKLLMGSIVDGAGCDGYRVFLTGRNNYRDDIATIQKYKDRPSRKPVHYQAIRDYLIHSHRAEVSDGNEADDSLGRAQTEDTVICTLDKDLDMVPGWHFKWTKNQLYNIGPTEGLRNFYEQLLKGDRTDSIPGLPGIGDKKAAQALRGVTKEENMWRVAQHMYNKHSSYDYYDILEIGNLLWIQQQGRLQWTPPSA